MKAIKPYIFTLCLGFGLVSFMGLGISWLSAAAPVSPPRTLNEGSRIIVPEGPSFPQVDSIMDDRRTALTKAQKEAYWSTVVGQRVTWRGVVTQVDRAGTISLKCNRQSWFSDVAAQLDGTPASQLLSLRKGQLVTIEGTLRSHGWTGYQISQGTIVAF